MNLPLLVCFIILAVQICCFSASPVTNLKSIQKRLVNGSPINDFYENWFSTATLDIFHYSNGTWQRHPICLGTFFQVGISHMIITAADCFFPPGYDHTMFSYMSKNNYRVFLGVVRIRYGTREYSNANRFGLRSTVTNPIIIIHPEWKFGKSNEDTNIAVMSISYNCVVKLNEAVTKRLISDLPQFLDFSESDEIVSVDCAVAGWKTDLVADVDVFAPHSDHKNVSLTSGKFVSLNSANCNQHFTSLNITKRLEDPSFCISGTNGDCIEVYLSQYEYGSGVICGGKWSGFVSAIFAMNTEASNAPFVQLATVSSTAAIRRFVDVAHLIDSAYACIVTQVTPAQLGKGDKKSFNPNWAKDFASP